MRSFLIATLLLISAGCASLPQFGGGSVSDSIGAAYASITSLAETIQLECGNTVPGGECRAGSVLDRGDVNSMRDDLQRAKSAVDEANRLYLIGQGGEAGDHLTVARTILGSLRAALELREVR